MLTSNRLGPNHEIDRNTIVVVVRGRAVLILYPWQGNHKLLLNHYRPRPSILRMMRSAHWTALAIKDSVLGLGRDSCRSSGFLRCLATRMPATMAKTRLRPSSMWIRLAYSLFVCYCPKIAVMGQFPVGSLERSRLRGGRCRVGEVG